MLTISTSHPEACLIAQKAINNSGLIAFPTDTVYGVAASAFDPVAIGKIYRAKNRSQTKSLPVLIGNIGQLNQIITTVPPLVERLMDHFWPGALTIILWKHPSLPPIISKDQTIGVRMPNNRFIMDLLRVTGPLATTSANQSGQPDALTAAEVRKQIGGKIDLLLDGGKVKLGIPSTVVDCTKEHPVILRQGSISEESIINLLK